MAPNTQRRALRSVCRWSDLASLVYRSAQKVMTLDITTVIWLERGRLCQPCIDEDRFSFRFLSATDVEQFAQDRETDLQRSMAVRIRQGRDFCFAAFCGHDLASYAWFALGSIEAEHHRGKQPRSGVALSYPPHVAFMYKGYTHPAYRGHRLYGAVVARGFLGLQEQGVDSILSTMDWTNVSARKALARIGCQELGHCYRWGWGTWMHTWAPRRARRLGARFGMEAEVEIRPDVLALGS